MVRMKEPKIKWVCNNCNKEFESDLFSAGDDKKEHLLDCCWDLIEDLEE